VHASRTQYTPSTRQDSDPTQDHRDRHWRDHGRHPVGGQRWPWYLFPHLGRPAAFSQASDSLGRVANWPARLPPWWAQRYARSADLGAPPKVAVSNRLGA